MFRALLVDDEKMALVSLEHSIDWNLLGFTGVTKTTNPEEAIELLKSNRFDVAFLDIRMPKISGFDIMTACKDMKISTDFIMVSGYSDFSYTKNAIQLGAFDYCLKPVEASEASKLSNNLLAHIIYRRQIEDCNLIDTLTTYNQPDDILRWCGLPKSRYLNTVAIRYINLSDTIGNIPRFPDEICLLYNSNTLLKIIPSDIICTDDILTQYKKISEISVAIGDALENSQLIGRMIKRTISDLEENGYQNIVLRTIMTEPNTANENFLKMFYYIEDNFVLDLSLQELAENYNLNYTYCSELFRDKLGMTYSQFVTSLRMKKATELLLKTTETVESVCYRTGYNNYHYFANVFKKTYSMTPSQYRKTKCNIN